MSHAPSSLPELPPLIKLDTNLLQWFSEGSDYQKSLASIPEPLRTQLSVPRPFNKGDDWYAFAIAAIESDIPNFECGRDWRQWWSESFVFVDFREHFEEYLGEYLWDIGCGGIADIESWE